MKMRFLLLLGFAAGFACAQNTGFLEPAGQLYDRGLKLAEEGRFDSARSAFQTLINHYPKTVLATEAQDTADAMLLLEEGQERIKAGKYDTAKFAFQTLISVYPESPLVSQAKDGIQRSEQLGQSQGRTPIVRSIRYESVKQVSVKDIQQRFNEREVALELERPFEAQDLEQAKAVLTELLVERGVANPRVKTQVRELPPRSVEVRFTVTQN